MDRTEWARLQCPATSLLLAANPALIPAFLPITANLGYDLHDAMRFMRVCVENLEVYNCGKCEKCIRTMCNAAAAGVSDQLQTLPPVTPDDIRNMPLRRPTAVRYHLENLRHLRELPPEKRRPELEDAIEARLQTYCDATGIPLASLGG